MTDPRKPIFDAIRAARGKGFDQMEIGAIDNLLDALGVPTLGKGMTTSQKGIALIHEFESYAKALPNGDCQAYPDPATGGKPWTIGWGSTTDEQGRPIKQGTVWTRARADARFAQHLAAFEQDVNELLAGKPCTQGQFDALVSFAYNVGSDIDQDTIAEGLGDSTLLKKHLRGDYAGAAAEFGRWNKANGKVMKGLTRRRAAEAALYRGEA
jgi:GH24 family phage-related lysozyme (muramidase)